MDNQTFQEIDNLHSQWTAMDKATRLGWLTGERMRLNRIADQFAQYIYVRGGFCNDSERAYANKLLEMLQEVEAKGTKVAKDLANDVLREVFKGLLR